MMSVLPLSIPKMASLASLYIPMLLLLIIALPAIDGSLNVASSQLPHTQHGFQFGSIVTDEALNAQRELETAASYLVMYTDSGCGSSNLDTGVTEMSEGIIANTCFTCSRTAGGTDSTTQSCKYVVTATSLDFYVYSDTTCSTGQTNKITGSDNDFWANSCGGILSDVHVAYIQDLSEFEFSGEHTYVLYSDNSCNLATYWKQLFMKVNMLGAANMIINQIPPEAPNFMQTLNEM